LILSACAREEREWSRGSPPIRRVLGAAEIVLSAAEIVLSAAEIVLSAAEIVFGAAEIEIGAAEIEIGTAVLGIGQSARRTPPSSGGSRVRGTNRRGGLIA
jgi:hypothetical protein